MDEKAYLQRLRIQESEANPENLKILQKKHLLTIPFENLDIHWKQPIFLDTKNFYTKIIEQNRGGFCYELNGLFNELLKKIGFQTKIISARVAKGDDQFGAEYDHLAILVNFNGADEYLVDVGFGDFTTEPLRFVLNVEQVDDNGVFMIRKFDEEYFEVVKKEGDGWRSEYIFRVSARELPEFTEMCHFHQTSPKSHFTRGKLCSIMIENGRKTLSERKFIKTKHGKTVETEVNSDEEFYRFLEQEFGINQPPFANG